MSILTHIKCFSKLVQRDICIIFIQSCLFVNCNLSLSNYVQLKGRDEYVISNALSGNVFPITDDSVMAM